MRVAVVHAGPDGAVASRIAAGLRDSGIEPIAVDGGAATDGLVVLISSQALSDPAWLEAVEPATTGRVVPVRVGELDDESVPPRLRELNWIDWVPERPATTLGFILAGLFANPDMYRLSQQLAHEAETWDRAGRPKERLVADRGRARRMSELMAALVEDPMATPDAVVVDFVEASDSATRKARRRRLLWRGGAGIALLVAISAVTSVVASIQAFSRINHAAIVTAGDESVIDELPEWSAANAAMLVLNGTNTQRELGTTTLIQAMARPWSLGTISFIDSIRSMVPFADGTRSAVVALTPSGSSFAEVDVTRGRTIGYLSLPGKFEQVDVSGDSRYVAVAGDGAGIIPFHTRQFHPVASRGDFIGVRASGPRLLLWTDAGRLEARDVANGGSHLVGEFRKVLDVAPDGRGGGTALVASGPGRYEIVDISSGAVLASEQIPAGEEIGALAPGRKRAVVDAADTQFWTFGVGRPPRPTGISVPASLQDLEWAGGERLVIASDSERGQVVYLPRGQQLGRLCADAPSIEEIRLEAHGDIVACGGDARSIWRLPPAPGVADEKRVRPLGRWIRSPYAQVEIRGRWMRVSLRGAFGSASASPIELFDSKITAAAFSPTDHQFAIGSARGSVMVVGLSRHGTRGVVMWSAPDASPISELSWKQGLVATTTSGQTWALPDCPGCQSDAGLLAEARSRFSGCFSDRQMAWIDSGDRAALGLRECEPIAVLEAD
jgi:hypothetical protein